MPVSNELLFTFECDGCDIDATSHMMVVMQREVKYSNTDESHTESVEISYPLVSKRQLRVLLSLNDSNEATHFV